MAYNWMNWRMAKPGMIAFSKIGSFVYTLLVYAIFFTLFSFVNFAEYSFVTDTLGIDIDCGGGYTFHFLTFLYFLFASVLVLLVPGIVVILQHRIFRHKYAWRSLNHGMFVFMFGFYLLNHLIEIIGPLNVFCWNDAFKSYIEIVCAFIVVSISITIFTQSKPNNER